MIFNTFSLDATDTPKTIKELLGITSKYRHLTWIRIYAESTNNSGATGSARIGDSVVSRGDIMGIPLLPGILDTETFKPAGGGIYHLDRIYITGEAGDTFQIMYDHL